MSNADTVFVIAVTHQSVHAVDAFAAGLDRLLTSSPRTIRAVVVDNASRDGTPDHLRARGLDVVACEENRGWSAGNNRGLARCPDDAAFVLFLNPDVIASTDALERLVAPLTTDERVAAVVPRLRGGAGPRAGAHPTFDLADAYLGVFGRRRGKERRLATRLERGGVVPLAGAYPEGGCLLVRRSALDAIGPFDERFFLYFDDVDFGRRLTESGRTAVLAADALVDESEAKGSRATPDGDAAAERVARYRRYLESELRYYAKWWSPEAARRVARYRLRVDLPIQERRWRRRHGIGGVRDRVRDVVQTFLAGEDVRA